MGTIGLAPSFIIMKLYNRLCNCTSGTFVQLTPGSGCAHSSTHVPLISLDLPLPTECFRWAVLYGSPGGSLRGFVESKPQGSAGRAEVISFLIR